MIYKKLQDAKISYSLGHYTYSAIMVTIVVPGERWEVEFQEDGEIDIEIFKSNGHIHTGKEIPEILDNLFRKHSD